MGGGGGIKVRQSSMFTVSSKVQFGVIVYSILWGKKFVRFEFFLIKGKQEGSIGWFWGVSGV